MGRGCIVNGDVGGNHFWKSEVCVFRGGYATLHTEFGLGAQRTFGGRLGVYWWGRSFADILRGAIARGVFGTSSDFRVIERTARAV